MCRLSHTHTHTHTHTHVDLPCGKQVAYRIYMRTLARLTTYALAFSCPVLPLQRALASRLNLTYPRGEKAVEGRYLTLPGFFFFPQCLLIPSTLPPRPPRLLSAIIIAKALRGWSVCSTAWGMGHEGLSVDASWTVGLLANTESGHGASAAPPSPLPIFSSG
jgi:hypothetical protein